jgi:dihydrofolate synthase/folylpolyglutamate synthase
MQFAHLSEWLAWQETLHPTEIELGLERVRQVWHALSGKTFTCPVVTVAGTNGKGSSVATLSSIYQSAGYQVGSYTSPHLWRYNERIAINGIPVDDATICAAFAAIENVRHDVSLTYFEYGTLAALWIFQQHRLDVVILEVGLGGRLDAVNIIDADVALITSIDLEHQEWLGDTREKIALEKAGVMRTGRYVVINDSHPPATLIEYAQNLAAQAYCHGSSYTYQRDGGQWHWQSSRSIRSGLPLPAFPGAHQLQNAAGVLMVVELLKDRLPVAQNQLREGLLAASLPGRFQIVQGDQTIIYDVAHNPAAAVELARALQAYREQQSVHIVFSVLRDKDIAGVVRPFCFLTAHWYVAPLGVSRAADLRPMTDAIVAQCPTSTVHETATVAQALQQARDNASRGDIILVFGSFYTVAQAHP